MNQLDITPIRAFSDNYIWAIKHTTNAVDGVWVVDPGDATPVINWLNSTNNALAGILITHHHFDHTGGIPTLAQHFAERNETELPVIGPANNKISGLTQQVREGDTVRILETDFQVLEVPGHTLDHIAYHSPQNRVLFCGDTLFSAGCGRLFEGTPNQMFTSLQKFGRLTEDTEVYCTHEYTLSNLKFALAVEGDNTSVNSYYSKVRDLQAHGHPSLPSTIGLEKAVNPFLRTADASVIAAASKHSGQPIATLNANETAVLAALRSWKDNF